ncbi:MAG: TetR/AcrR family transcriptional regulator [Halobacteriota archaeon]
MTECFDSPTDTREEILAAAYRALSVHGYADLTIEKIGEEFEKSTSLIYHHFDGKDDLLLACLEYMLGQFETDAPAVHQAAPTAAIEEILDWVLQTDTDREQYQFLSSLTELRMQAAHDERYVAHFTKSDRVLHDRLTAVIRYGIETEAFTECDPEAVAATIQTSLLGAMVRGATTENDEWVEPVRNEIQAYLRQRLYG